MSKEYREITADISAYLAKLRKEIPEVMTGFSAMAQAATQDGALDKKTKELIALALGVSPKELGLERHIVSTKPILEKLGF